ACCRDTCGPSQNTLRTSRRISMIAVVILSAGESRRMGQPKALLPFPENFSSAQSQRTQTAQTFLEHLIEVTRHPRAGILRVVVGAHAMEIRAQAKLDADELVVNEQWQRGQLSSLQAAIRSLPEDATENIGARVVVHAHATEVTEVPVEEEGIVRNLNDPAALERAHDMQRR